MCLVHTGVSYKAAPPSHRLSPGFPVLVPPELIVITAVGMKALLNKVFFLSPFALTVWNLWAGNLIL